MITFDIIAGGNSGKSFEFDKVVITIGRNPDCDLVLSDTGISRQHATVRYVSGGFVLENQSANGTLLNGSEINSEKLKTDDIIEIGESISLRVTIKGLTERSTAVAAIVGRSSDVDDPEAPTPIYKKPAVLIIGGGYLLACLILVVALSFTRTESEDREARDPHLNTDDFRYAMLGDLPRVPKNDQVAEEHATQALHYFALRPIEPSGPPAGLLGIADVPRSCMWAIAEARLALAYAGYQAQDQEQARKMFSDYNLGPSGQKLLQHLGETMDLLEPPLLQVYERATVLDNSGGYKQAIQLYRQIHNLIREVDCPLRRAVSQQIEILTELIEAQN